MNIFTSLFARRDRQRTYADLMRLDDHLLRDIGVSRADVHQMMAGARTAHRRADRDHE